MKKYSKKIISFVLVVMMSIIMLVPAFANGEISVYLDNEKIQFDVAPLLVNGRTMVPMRAIFEKLGATVYWDDNTRTAIAQKGNTNISIAIDDTTLYKNSVPVTLDVPAQLKDGRTLVPLRAVSEAFECDVQWNGDTTTVNISSNNNLNPRQKKINELRTWISKNYNHSLDNETKDFGYITEYGSNDFRVSYDVDSSDVKVFYVIRSSEEIIGISFNLSDLQFMGTYAFDKGLVFLNGYIGGSIYSNSLELVETSYENNSGISKNIISEKIKEVANISLKAFDTFLKSNNLGLTLKDFGLDYDLSSVDLNDNQTPAVIPTPSYPQNNAPNNSYQGGGGYTTNTKITLSSFPLYLYADDGTGTFLGNINSNQFDTDSIANQFGKYGSEFQTKSIFNEFGTYGSQFSRYSPFNEFASNPPKILDKNGKVVGYLTSNKYIKDAISYEEMMVLLKKFNK